MLFGLGFALVVCVASMAVAVTLNLDGLEWLSHAIVLIVFVGGSFATLAYTKGRVARAVFGSTCSLALLIISAVCVGP